MPGRPVPARLDTAALQNAIFNRPTSRAWRPTRWVLLPGMDGWEFLARIKEVPALQGIPVVITSIVADRKRGFSLGAAAVLEKPVSRQDLYQTLVGLGLVHHAQGQTLNGLVVGDDPATLGKGAV